MKTRFTVSPHEDAYAVFGNGEFHSVPGTGTWGACKKVANKLNDDLRTHKMKYGAMLAKPEGSSFPSSYILERKWDGMRAIFEVGETTTSIFSRTGQDLNPQFPELCQLHEVLPPCILDGEIVAMESEDKENLELLQERSGDKKARRMAEIPVTVKFFDVLEISGIDTRSLPLRRRRERLEGIVGPDFTVELAESIDFPPHWEGVVAKDPESIYVSGKRRASWVKVKQTHRATLRVVSLTPGKGARLNSFGAIVVEDENGVPRGQVGTGFPGATIDQIMELHGRGEFVGSLVEVEYRFLSKSGLMVNTAFKGFRWDKKEADVL